MMDMAQTYLDKIRRRREEILERVDIALDHAGRHREDLKIMAVSKTVDIDAAADAVRAGYTLLGENRPQELVRKFEGLRAIENLPEYRLDMIGNLQKNKINAVLGHAGLIHSIESAALARAVSERAARRVEAGELSAPQRVLLEVNVSGEESKSGFEPEALRACIEELMELSGISICGLMTMAPRGSKEMAAKTFAGLRELRDELEGLYPALELRELSCGMSEDFDVAIEEGSTLIRLGRVAFNPSFALQ
ncbi:YggS family pyridoxal phosphate-dependent enzyme [Collinsella bouchesdurhonensis]|uniref:YggS family pyridoxal phosphate-dependent enzyme n=1 Tax=Collinsella bouchesdurhonensis TaxID=1907654 RepID=UPI000B32E999